MPAVEEPDIVLVSCAGAGVDESVREAVVEAKQRGEAAVKASGLATRWIAAAFRRWCASHPGACVRAW